MVTSDEGKQEMSIISAEIYLPHDPINVTSNDGFVSDGWMGEGTLDNPYMIELFEFTNSAEVDGPCISISNTTAFFKITNCIFNTTTFASAIALDNVTNGQIQYCITGNYVWSITIDNCTGIKLEHMSINACIVVDDSYLCSFSHCSIQGAPGDGIYFENCKNMTVLGCDISICAANGIWLRDTTNSTIIGNKLLDNSMYQIEITGVSYDNTIFNNVLDYDFMTSMGTGHDNGITNYWDDNISTGNWWSDYGESGDYDISGSAGSIDHYPMGHSSVLLVDHCNESFHITTNSSILWDAFSEVPEYFIIYRDGEIHESDVWDGLDISTSVVTDALGLFNYTIFVNGTSGNNKTDTVMVTIYDSVPTIDSPNDISYIHGETGNYIVWNPSSINPAEYEIYRNEILYFSDTWDGSPISFSVDGQNVGTHYFKLCVFDTSGNSANDTVQVIVTLASTSTSTNTTTTTFTGTSTPIDSTLILTISFASIIVILVVIVVIFKKRS